MLVYHDFFCYSDSDQRSLKGSGQMIRIGIRNTAYSYNIKCNIISEYGHTKI